MLKHIAVRDQIKLLSYGFAPVRQIQVERQHPRTKLPRLFRSFRINFNAHHTRAARSKLPRKKSSRASAFQDVAVFLCFFNEKMVPAETIAIGGDLIATAFQVGVLHQRFVGKLRTIVTSVLFLTLFRFSHYNEESPRSQDVQTNTNAIE